MGRRWPQRRGNLNELSAEATDAAQILGKGFRKLL